MKSDRDEKIEELNKLILSLRKQIGTYNLFVEPIIKMRRAFLHSKTNTDNLLESNLQEEIEKSIKEIEEDPNFVSLQKDIEDKSNKISQLELQLFQTSHRGSPSFLLPRTEDFKKK